MFSDSELKVSLEKVNVVLRHRGPHLTSTMGHYSKPNPTQRIELPYHRSLIFVSPVMNTSGGVITNTITKKLLFLDIDFRRSHVYNACETKQGRLDLSRPRFLKSATIAGSGWLPRVHSVLYAQCNDQAFFGAWRREAP